MKYNKKTMNFSRFFGINNYLRYFIDNILIQFYVLLWKKKGVQIGKKINFLSIPILEQFKRSEISIGDNCLICSISSKTALGVAHPVIIRTLNSNAIIKIGNNVRMSGTSICSMSSISIGNRCVIGADVIIADTDFHSLDSVTRSSKKDSLNAITNPIIIGDDVFIGGRSILLKGVQLGDQVIVGAGSVVTRSFENGSVIAGNPAVLIKRVNY